MESYISPCTATSPSPDLCRYLDNVKEQLGHTSIQMTVDIYGHLIPSSNREMVNRLDSQPAATCQKRRGAIY